MAKKTSKKSVSKDKKSIEKENTENIQYFLTKDQIFKKQVEIMLEDFSEKKDKASSSEERSILCAEIERVWAKYPYMNLGKLLVNISDHRDLFYVRDKDILEKFKEYP